MPAINNYEDENGAEDVECGIMAGYPSHGAPSELGGPACTTTQQLKQQTHAADSGTEQAG